VVSVTIVKAVQTCMACPAQWDAWDSEGRFWYLRYRHAHGEARRYDEGPGWYKAEPADGKPWIEPAEALDFDYGDSPYDGDIELPLFCELAGLVLSPDAEVTGWGTYMSEALAEALGLDPGSVVPLAPYEVLDPEEQ
jgi:hypothetical protein